MTREERAELVRRVVIAAIRAPGGSARSVASESGVSHASVANFAAGKVQVPDERTVFAYEQWADRRFPEWRAEKRGRRASRAAVAAVDRLVHALNLAVLEKEITPTAVVQTVEVLRERFPEIDAVVWDTLIARHTEGAHAATG